MQTNKLPKHALFLGTVLLATSLFAACANPTQQSTNSQPIQIGNKVLSDTKVQATQTETERETTMPAKTYKELTDFKEIQATQAVLETTKGTIVIDLFREKTPLTTANFLNLIDEGFYDGIVFHRVIPDFMAQVGDPLTKDPSTPEAYWGTGGPDYKIMDEFHEDLKHDDAGILSMANAGPNTGGSQIFITYGPQPHLDGKHAVFGKVAEGMDVLESITQGDKIISASYR